MEETPHGRLVGLEDAKLLNLAPDATHQHRKGGLYRDLGVALAADTKTSVTGADGHEMRAWEHVHPHARQVLLRSTAEDDRFRRLEKGKGHRHRQTPMPDSWMAHAIAGNDPGDIDDWVERWHDGDSKLELHEFLGMTWEEYGNFALAPACLPGMVETRRLVEEGRLQFHKGVAENTGHMN